MDFLHVAVAVVGEAPNVIEVSSLLYVVSLIGVHEPQLHVTEIAHAKRLVCLFDGEIDKLTLYVGVVARCLVRIGDDHIYNDVPVAARWPFGYPIQVVASSFWCLEAEPDESACQR